MAFSLLLNPILYVHGEQKSNGDYSLCAGVAYSLHATKVK
jgi:hypothetical protein